MTRTLPLLLPLVAACGPKAELIRYTIEAEILDVPPWLDAESAGVINEIPACTNAEVFDETIRVYDGYVEGAVTAIQIHWTGFDLSSGGENIQTWFLRKGELFDVVAAIKPDLVLYQVDDKGRMLQVDKDAAKVKGRDRAEATYELGEGLPIREVHEMQKEVELIDLVDQGAWNCEHTQL